jgi:integrase
MAKPRINRKSPTGLLTLKFKFHPSLPPFAWSTRQHCELADWDAKAGRAKVRDAINQPHLTDLNGLLNRICEEVLSCHRKHYGQVQLTADLYRAHMDGKFRPQAAAKALTLPAHIHASIAERQKNPEKNRANTLDSMADIAKMLERFAADTRASLDIERIDRAWFDAFTRWAYSQGYAKGSVGLYITRIKATVKDANERRLVDVDYLAIKSVAVRTKKGEVNKLYLEPEEVDAIAAFDYLAAGPYTLPNLTGYNIGAARLQRCADVIVANCQTGTRHSDLSKLKPDNVRRINGKPYIEVVTEKTGARVLIPIFGQLFEILEKFDYRIPAISKMEMLVVGRAVLHMAGVDRQVAFRDTKGGKLTTTHLPIWEKFAPHECRRTFARTAYMTDPSLLPNIQMILGHATPEQTLDYMDLTDAFSAEAFVRKMERQGPNRLRAVK